MTLRMPQLLQAYDDVGGGINNFVDFDNGVQKIDLANCAEDYGELSEDGGRTILFCNWYFRRSSQDINYHDLDNKVWTFEIAGENVDLKGGRINPFVVIADSVPEYYPNGNHQPPSSGRYWLNTKDIALGTYPSFGSTAFSVPSNTGWWRSYSRLGVTPLNPVSPQRPPPELRGVECLGLGIQRHSSMPSGIIHVKRMQVGD